MDEKLKIEYEDITGSSFTDCLTNVFNHGFFHTILNRQISVSKRDNSTFTLAFIDIDLFTLYNKKFGHVKGDKALKIVAEIIQENIRESDLVARIYGDIFAVILRNTIADAALHVSERIRSKIVEVFNETLTVSIGLATYHLKMKNRENILQKTREALYQAKMRGKNRVHFLEESKLNLLGSKPKILIVDDNPMNIKVMEVFLKPENYEILKAFNGEEAFALLRKIKVDLILLDVLMPGINGYEVCRQLKNDKDTRRIPIIMITALEDMEAKVNGIRAGADDFISRPPDEDELKARCKSLLKVSRLNKNLSSIENVLYMLANSVEAKDLYTDGHTRRVANLAQALGTKMQLNDELIISLKIGGYLHDVGKISIPESILNKPAPLSEEELKIVKKHTEIGYSICKPLENTLGSALDVVRHHHERLDGSSYPDGLKGNEISIASRIMAVVDMYDALITDRAYRKAMSKEEAISLLKKEVEDGKLDGDIVSFLIDLVSGK